MVKEDKKVDKVKSESIKDKKTEIEKANQLEINPGDVVRVHEIIKEKNSKGEEKQRVQVFEGIVLAHKHGNEIGATITVRKESGGIGVEKIFPIHSPLIEKIEVKGKIKSRKSKLYYLRNYKKRLKKVVLK
jgi:large subunit ribosomal protein L19